jgi:hypothetical protein
LLARRGPSDVAPSAFSWAGASSRRSTGAWRSPHPRDHFAEFVLHLRALLHVACPTASEADVEFLRGSMLRAAGPRSFRLTPRALPYRAFRQTEHLHVEALRPTRVVQPLRLEPSLASPKSWCAWPPCIDGATGVEEGPSEGARPTQLVRRALVPLRGPKVVGGYADVATRVGRAPGITRPLSRRAEAPSTARTLTSSSFQRRGPAHAAQAARWAAPRIRWSLLAR